MEFRGADFQDPSDDIFETNAPLDNGSGSWEVDDDVFSGVNFETETPLVRRPCQQAASHSPVSACGGSTKHDLEWLDVSVYLESQSSILARTS